MVRGLRWYSGSLLSLAVLVASCIEPGVQTCDELVCPAGTTCIAGLAGCFSDQDVAACTSVAEGGSCTSGTLEGVCKEGVCFAASCGDGILSDGEECDGSVPPGLSCLSYGFYEEGSLSCDNRCEIDTSQCTSYCGDDEINGFELCDGPDGSGRDCYELGFDAGRLACSGQCTPTFDDCVSFGWQQELASIPLDSSIIWVAPGGEIVAGEGDRIVYYDGMSWTEYDLSGVLDSFAVARIFGLAADYVIASDGAGKQAVFDGSAWTELVIPEITALLAGYAADGVLYVGANDGKVAVFDGTAWTIEQLPTDDPVVAVGEDPQGEILAAAGPELWRREPGNWTSVIAPPASIVGLARVGDQLFATTANESVYRSVDAGKWEEELSTAAYDALPPVVFDDMLVYSTTGVYAVHWRVAGNWFEQDRAGGSWVSAGGGILAATGTLGSIGRYGGATWLRPFNPPNWVAWKGELVDATPDGALLLADAGAGAQVAAFQGSAFTELRPDYGSDDVIRGLAGFSASSYCYGFFRIDIYNGNDMSFVSCWDGETALGTGTYPATQITDLAATSPTNIYTANGAEGAWHYDGSGWSKVISDNVIAIDVAPDGQVVAAGPSSLYRYDGTQVFATSISGGVRAVWSHGASFAAAVGSQGRAWTFDGSDWTEHSLPAFDTLHALDGTGPNDVWAAGNNGTIFRFDSLGWTRVRARNQQLQFRSVAVTEEAVYFGVLDGVTEVLIGH